MITCIATPPCISHSPMTPVAPKSVDTVIVGTGPSALILSYILRGNIPYYSRPHPDPILHSKLKPDLLDADVNFSDLTAHFPGSRYSYSTAALPVNVLLDTLLRPLADTEPGVHESCIEWRRDPKRQVCHVLLGDTLPGGQWSSNPVAASWDIGTLSYLDQLSLPGYSLRDHLRTKSTDQEADFLRPTRRDVASYLQEYASMVSVDCAEPSPVTNIRRTSNGFFVGSHGIHCKHLVLASGIFSKLLPARPQLQPLLQLPHSISSVDHPLLVVGSGFSAADIILTHLHKRKVLHIFKWDPENRPSPLRACHKQAYPDYAGVYRRMKRSAVAILGDDCVTSPLTRQKSNPFFKEAETDGVHYEGLPNTYIRDVEIADGPVGKVTLCLPNGTTTQRSVSSLEYVIGRRGSLAYLSPQLQQEVLGPVHDPASVDRISGRTLRKKVEEDLEVAPDVFVIGSLAGDSLIRHTYGSCAFAARALMSRRREEWLSERNEDAEWEVAAREADYDRPSKSACSRAGRKDGKRRRIRQLASEGCRMH